MLFYYRRVTVMDTGTPRNVTQRRHSDTLTKRAFESRSSSSAADEPQLLSTRGDKRVVPPSRKTHTCLIFIAS